VNGRRWAAVVIAAAGVLAALAMLSIGGHPHHRRLVLRAAAQDLDRERVFLGRSVRHKPIAAVVLGDLSTRSPVLIVGCIHGDEPAGISVAEGLARAPVPSRSTLWIVPNLNPDGVAARTRQNAHGVDLNRNFPYRWRPLGHPGDQQYSGPHALSEPESRIAYALILRLRPRITIWFHQPLGITDLSGGDPAIERRFSTLSGLPVRRLLRYPGSAAGWQDHRLAGTTAFVVELPPGRLPASQARRIEGAVQALARG
jgi:protein MpaA